MRNIINLNVWLATCSIFIIGFSASFAEASELTVMDIGQYNIATYGGTDMSADDSSRFSRLPTDRPLVIQIISAGGILNSVEPIATSITQLARRTFAETGLPLYVHVNLVCHSACIPLFRMLSTIPNIMKVSAEANSHFGFHSPFFIGTGTVDRDGREYYKKLLVRYGADTRWLESHSFVFSSMRLTRYTAGELADSNSGIVDRNQLKTLDNIEVEIKNFFRIVNPTNASPSESGAPIVSASCSAYFDGMPSIYFYSNSNIALAERREVSAGAKLRINAYVPIIYEGEVSDGIQVTVISNELSSERSARPGEVVWFYKHSLECK